MEQSAEVVVVLIGALVVGIVAGGTLAQSASPVIRFFTKAAAGQHPAAGLLVFCTLYFLFVIARTP